MIDLLLMLVGLYAIAWLVEQRYTQREDGPLTILSESLFIHRNVVRQTRRSNPCRPSNPR